MEQGDLSSLLSGVMSDPLIMQKLSRVLSDPGTAELLKGAMPQKEQEKPSAPLPMPPQSLEAQNRSRLISALKPYLNEDRRNKADKLLGLLTVLELSGNKNIFNGGK